MVVSLSQPYAPCSGCHATAPEISFVFCVFHYFCSIVCRFKGYYKNVANMHQNTQDRRWARAYTSMAIASESVYLNAVNSQEFLTTVDH